MGIGESKEIPGEAVQSQGPDSLWTIILTGADGACCVFSSLPEDKEEYDLCKAGVEVIHWNIFILGTHGT